MNLDAVLAAFVNPQTIILCLGVWIITYSIRTIVEALWRGAKGNIIWEEIFVPLGAIGNGAIFGAVLKTFVWPDVVGHSLSGRMMYGAICGVFSGFVYGRIRSWVGAVGGNAAATALKVAPAPAPTPLPEPTPLPPAPEEAPPLGGRGDDKPTA